MNSLIEMKVLVEKYGKRKLLRLITDCMSYNDDDKDGIFMCYGPIFEKKEYAKEINKECDILMETNNNTGDSECSGCVLKNKTYSELIDEVNNYDTNSIKCIGCVRI